MIELQRFSLILCLLSVPLLSSWPSCLYVSTTGSDSNLGTFDHPFLTIPNALSSPLFQLGDTVYVRGGIYVDSVTISISKSGTDAARYYLLACTGERPVLDFSSMTTNSSNRGIRLSGSYWYMRGFDIRGAGDNGMFVSGSNNTIEFCAFYENKDTGLQLGSGASNNRIINCDSYFNEDPGQGNADGFAPKLDVGSGNYFFGCRSWQNSDDGWDGYLRGANDVTTTLENCWCFKNGYLADGTPSIGNGNGYKLGGSDTKDLMHNFILIRCLSFDNRVKGFDQNNNRGSMTLYNCTGYRNSTNFALAESVAYSQGKVASVENCVALGAYGSLSAVVVQATNSWMNPPFAQVTQTDFLSADTTGVRGPRKPDGSLPDIAFMHLSPGSQLINAGTDVGISFSGPAPDLGAFETDGATDVISAEPATIAGFKLLQNYPNPFNPTTSISYDVPASGEVTVWIYDLRGRMVRELVDGQQSSGHHVAFWDGRDEHFGQVASGVYFVRVTFQGASQTKKIVLLR
jgi:hypothetical protein